MQREKGGKGSGACGFVKNHSVECSFGSNTMFGQKNIEMGLLVKFFFKNCDTWSYFFTAIWPIFQAYHD